MGYDSEDAWIARLLECKVHRSGAIPCLAGIIVGETIVLCRLRKHGSEIASAPGRAGLIRLIGFRVVD